LSELPLLVLDASAALALMFADEEGEEVETLLGELVARNGQIFVPSLFWYELGNGILSAGRTGRIDEAASGETTAYFGRLPIVTESDLSDAVRSRIHSLVPSHELTYYDAAYLELSERLACRLKTFDRHLLALQPRFPQIR